MKKERSGTPVFRSPLRTRLRIYAAVGLAIVSAWLYYTINAVFGRSRNSNGSVPRPSSSI
jgi:hypothetical protein